MSSAIIAMTSNSISQHLYSMKNTKLMCHCGMKVVCSIQHFLQSQESSFFCFLMVIHHFVFSINSRLTLNPETIIFINTIIVFVTATLLNSFNDHYPESWYSLSHLIKPTKERGSILFCFTEEDFILQVNEVSEQMISGRSWITLGKSASVIYNLVVQIFIIFIFRKLSFFI